MPSEGLRAVGGAQYSVRINFMGMTITEKILARAAGKEKVRPGELVDAKIDVVMCVDVTTPPAISMLAEKGIDRVFDREKIVVTPRRALTGCSTGRRLW
jgi:homoaconitase/3-isopropylmalate dehydratase large subunit